MGKSVEMLSQSVRMDGGLEVCAVFLAFYNVNAYVIMAEAVARHRIPLIALNLFIRIYIYLYVCPCSYSRVPLKL